MDEERPNRKNGKGNKLLKTSVGNVEIETPRDRNGTFEPELVPKRQRTLGVDLDMQILALYARGAGYGDISDHLQEMYRLDVSTATISRVTDKILPLVQEWRSRPLEAVYPFVWLDAIHYKVRHEGRVLNRAVYCIAGSLNRSTCSFSHTFKIHSLNMELVEIKGLFEMDFGSPSPTILSNDNELFIAFYADKHSTSIIPQERNTEVLPTFQTNS